MFARRSTAALAELVTLLGVDVVRVGSDLLAATTVGAAAPAVPGSLLHAARAVIETVIAVAPSIERLVKRMCFSFISGRRDLVLSMVQTFR